jgi:8-oxo-dGTP diphosphatase
MQIITVNLIALNNENKILIVKRAKTQSEAGQWSLPGGTVENNEPLNYSLIREIKEELNIKIKDFNLVKKINNNNVESYYYLGKINEDITLNKENSEYKWISLSDIPRMSYNQDNLIKDIFN